MKKYVRIAKQLRTYYVFLMLIYLVSFFMTPLLTRGLSIEEYGVYMLIISSVSLMSSFFALGFPQFIGIKFPSFQRKKQQNTLITVLTFEVVFLLFIVAILSFGFVAKAVLPVLNLSNYQWAFTYALILVFFMVLFDTFTNYLNATQRIEFQSFISFFNKAALLLFVFIIFFIKKSITLRDVLFMSMFATVLSIGLVMVIVKKDLFRSKARAKLSLLRGAFFFSFPTFISMVCTWILTVVDRYVLNIYKGADSVAYYALGYGLIFLIIAFSGIVYRVMYPHIAALYSQKKDIRMLYNALMKYGLIITLPSVVGMVVLRGEIISMISGSVYLASGAAVLFLAPIPILNFLVNVTGLRLFLDNELGFVAKAWIIVVVVNAGLNILLVPRFGIMGACIATTISYVLLLGIFLVRTRGRYVWNWKFLGLPQILLSALIMGLVIYFIHPKTLFVKMLTIALGVVVYVLLLFVFRVFSKGEFAIVRAVLPKKLQKAMMWVEEFFKSQGGNI